MPKITYECTIQPGRVITQELIGSVLGSTRVHDGELYVSVKNPMNPGGSLELVIEKRRVYVIIPAAFGQALVWVGKNAELLEEEQP